MQAQQHPLTNPQEDIGASRWVFKETVWEEVGLGLPRQERLHPDHSIQEPPIVNSILDLAGRRQRPAHLHYHSKNLNLGLL